MTRSAGTTAARLSVVLCLAPALASCLATPVSLAPGRAGLPAARSAASLHVAEKGPTLAPMAHVAFCRQQPADCRRDGKGDVVPDLNGASLAALQRVNDEVNAAITPANDGDGPLDDDWTLSPSSGDCEDYAVTKRHRLIAMGWPVAALRLLVAETGEGEDHAALLVRTSQGDLVLDNRIRQILPVGKTDLSLIKIQSRTDPRRWVGA